MLTHTPAYTGKVYTEYSWLNAITVSPSQLSATLLDAEEENAFLTGLEKSISHRSPHKYINLTQRCIACYAIVKILFCGILGSVSNGGLSGLCLYRSINHFSSF